jgi:hypothetical protein
MDYLDERIVAQSCTCLRNPFIPGFFKVNVVVIADSNQQEEHVSNIMGETGRTSWVSRTLSLGDQCTFGKNADDSTQFHDERTWVPKDVRPEQFLNALCEMLGIVHYVLKFHLLVGAQRVLNSFLRNAAHAATSNLVFFNLRTMSVSVKEDLRSIWRISECHRMNA